MVEVLRAAADWVRYDRTRWPRADDGWIADMANRVTILLRLTLEEARAYWKVADEILGRAEPYKEVLEQEGEDLIDAAEQAHDRLREQIEEVEGSEE